MYLQTLKRGTWDTVSEPRSNHGLLVVIVVGKVDDVSFLGVTIFCTIERCVYSSANSERLCAHS